MKFRIVSGLCQGEAESYSTFDSWEIRDPGFFRGKTEIHFQLATSPMQTVRRFDPLMFAHAAGGYQTFHFQLVFDLSEKWLVIVGLRHSYRFHSS